MDEAFSFPTLATALLFGAIVFVTRIISDNRLRRRMVDNGLTPELISAISAPPRKDADRLGALKWGLVFSGVGIALIINSFLPFGLSDPASTGLVLLFGAGGLLLFYRLTEDGDR
jgi:hypothetical protein